MFTTFSLQVANAPSGILNWLKSMAPFKMQFPYRKHNAFESLIESRVYSPEQVSLWKRLRGAVAVQPWSRNDAMNCANYRDVWTCKSSYNLALFIICSRTRIPLRNAHRKRYSKLKKEEGRICSGNLQLHYGIQRLQTLFPTCLSAVRGAEPVRRDALSSSSCKAQQGANLLAPNRRRRRWFVSMGAAIARPVAR